jgi:hypothetical protein
LFAWIFELHRDESSGFLAMTRRDVIERSVEHLRWLPHNFRKLSRWSARRIGNDTHAVFLSCTPLAKVTARER